MPPKPKRPKKGAPTQQLDLPPHMAPNQQPCIPSPMTLTQQPYIPSPMAPTQQPYIPFPMGPTQQSHIPFSMNPTQQSHIPMDPLMAHMASNQQPYIPPSMAPTQQPHASTQKKSARRETTKVWTVQVIDEQGNTKKVQLTKPSVFVMPHGERIVVPFDSQLRAYGEAATLLSSACGRIATDSKNIPINFDSWSNVPKSYKDGCFNIVKNLFHFQAPKSAAERYCFLCMSRKYKNGKTNLWNSIYDTSLSREQLIANVPDGIHKDQWSSFVDYHLRPEYKELCRKNTEVRKKQKIPHTGGSKLLSTKQHEMEVDLGRVVGRGELYIATHKKKNGSYVNEEARSIGDKMTQEMSQSDNFTEISANDGVGKVLGKDHTGRVRCLGLGGLHSVAFRSTTSFSGSGSGFSNSDSAECSRLKDEVTCLRDKLTTSEENVKTLKNVMLAYIQMKEGHIPFELGAMFGHNASNVVDEGSGQDGPTPRGGSSLDSNFHAT